MTNSENCALARDGKQDAYQWRVVSEVFQLSRSIICDQCLVLKVKKEGQLLRISVKQQRGHLTGFGLIVVR